MDYVVPKVVPEAAKLHAITNAALLAGVPRTIFLYFHGVDRCDQRPDPGAFEIRCAKENILTVYPDDSPGWMDEGSERRVDGLLDALRVRWALPEATPVVAGGEAMGGLRALLYTRYARVTPRACLTSRPVCDLPGHCRRAGLTCGAEEERRSPLHQVPWMPKIPYYVVDGDGDAAGKIMHSDRFVNAMRQAGHDVTYREVYGMRRGERRDGPGEREEWEEAVLEYCE